jgi:hypothetical protein
MTDNICPACGHSWSTEKTFTAAEIEAMTPEQHEANRIEIMKAMAEGRIQR